MEPVIDRMTCIVYLRDDEIKSYRVGSLTQYESIPDPHDDYVTELLEGIHNRKQLLRNGVEECELESHSLYGYRNTILTVLKGGITSSRGDTSAFKNGSIFKDEKAMVDAVNRLCPNYFLMKREKKRKTGSSIGEFRSYAFECKHAGKPRAWVKGTSTKIDCPASIRFWKGASDLFWECSRFEESHNHSIQSDDETKIRYVCTYAMYLHICNMYIYIICIYFIARDL
jgi:hypothetical protein